QRRRVGWSAFLSTTIEYYDFRLYGLMGPIVFGKLFFPQSDPTTALIAILAIYTVGFFGRPLGGLVFSHYGDRLGRKPDDDHLHERHGARLHTHGVVAELCQHRRLGAGPAAGVAHNSGLR